MDRGIERRPDDVEPATTAAELSVLLRELGSISAAYVHPRPLSFRDGAQKTNWAPALPDVESRDVISAFIGAPRGVSDTKLALVSAPAGSWVGTGNTWSDAPWHCLAIAIIKRHAGGVDLVIYDNDAKLDADSSMRVKDVLWGIQRNLFDSLRKRHKTVVVWYSTDQADAGSGRCLARALDRLRLWAAHGGGRIEEGDTRVAGFVRLSRL